MAEKNWFVFYTKSRQEKKVRDLLSKAGYTVFLPMQKVMRQWTDRKKKVEVPLFNSYIFVQEFEHNIPTVLTIPGIAWNIRHNGKPAVLRHQELEIIERFLATGLFLETSGADADILNTGDHAEIIDGPLAGMKGTVTGGAGDEKFTVQLEGINQVIRVQIPAYLLKKQ
jgi:transcription termination/antitermination protein NusG